MKKFHTTHILEMRQAIGNPRANLSHAAQSFPPSLLTLFTLIAMWQGSPNSTRQFDFFTSWRIGASQRRFLATRQKSVTDAYFATRRETVTAATSVVVERQREDEDHAGTAPWARLRVTRIRQRCDFPVPTLHRKGAGAEAAVRTIYEAWTASPGATERDG